VIGAWGLVRVLLGALAVVVACGCLVEMAERYVHNGDVSRAAGLAWAMFAIALLLLFWNPA
jgi:hypothetical protein